jgi:hypothetical protein
MVRIENAGDTDRGSSISVFYRGACITARSARCTWDICTTKQVIYSALARATRSLNVSCYRKADIICKVEVIAHLYPGDDRLALTVIGATTASQVSIATTTHVRWRPRLKYLRACCNHAKGELLPSRLKGSHRTCSPAAQKTGDRRNLPHDFDHGGDVILYRAGRAKDSAMVTTLLNYKYDSQGNVVDQTSAMKAWRK